MNRRQKGTFYEEIASSYLQKHGIRIIEKNYRIKQGEVDLIGEDASHLIFFEVKYRKDKEFGEPWESVFVEKRKRIGKVALQYIYSRKVKKQVRYDVISICGDEISWFKNAFYHEGYY